MSPHEALVLACPLCHRPWPPPYARTLTCPDDDLTFTLVDGIWRFLLPERATRLQPFIREYERVREAEGWGGTGPAHYRGLPFHDSSRRHPFIWHIRSGSYRAFREKLLPPRARPQRILDLGAGAGWLAYRLARAGHRVAAVDLMVNGVDGLGTHHHYDASYLPLQAEFDHLPLADAQADMVIFNGAFHYSVDYGRTLREALRVLRPKGRIVIMDSPLYRDGGSGRQMVQEREERFLSQYGFRGNALPHENYLTFRRLDEVAAELSLRWRFIQPTYGLRWAIRPWLARLRGHREPATFHVIVGDSTG